MLRMLVLAGVCAVLAAGCGSDGDGARLATPPATSPATSSATSPTSPTATAAEESRPPATPRSGAPTTAASPAPLQSVELRTVEVATGLANPLQILPRPGGDGLVLVEQIGRVRVAAGGELTTILDISDRVVFQGEQGLLAAAFHPDHPDDRRLFLHYSGAPDGRTVLSSVTVAADGTVEEDSETVLLEREQPAANHNGGMLRFGPDGMLYLGLGDGGAAADRFGNGQDTSTLLGGILRMDVDTEPGTPAAPPDNPFVDGRGADLLWHYGLRNPWRFTFDEGSLYVADVGQDAVEELSVVSAEESGLNFGWPVLEGSRCFRSEDCDRTGLVLPAVEYTHEDTGGCSIIGGEVYRGEALPELRGHYLYADLCAGLLRSVRYEPGGGVVEEAEWTDHVGGLDGVLGFGTDGAGELYAGLQDGRVLRFAPG